MTPDYILNKYKAYIHDTKQAISYYEKYRHCYAIHSADVEMQDIKNKIGLSYVRLRQIYASPYLGTNDDDIEITEVIAESENLNTGNSLFDRVIDYVDTNKTQLIGALDDHSHLKRLKTDLDVLKTCLTYVNKLVDRMREALKSSQQIYHGNHVLLKTA